MRYVQLHLLLLLLMHLLLLLLLLSVLHPVIRCIMH
jgi:hypothetical protein